MPETVFGLPTHALLVHASVVLIPLAALLVALHALWPGARRRLGVVTPLAAAAALVLTPLSTESGESLERLVGRSPLVERHAQLADGLLPWTVALFVVAVAVWFLGRPDRGARPRWLPVVVGVLAVAAAAGTVQQVVRIGHAGAEATWSDVVGTS